MLGVINDLTTIGFQIGHRIGDHRNVFISRLAQHFLDVKKPGLAENGNDRRFGINQQLDLSVLFHRNLLAPSGSECRDFGVFPALLGCLLEKLNITWIRTRPAAFNIMNTKCVEAFRQPDLVRYGKIDAFTLGSIPQGRVVYLYFGFLFGHTSAFIKS